MQHSELGIAPSRSIFHTPTRYALQVLVRLPSDGTYRLARCLAADLELPGPYLAEITLKEVVVAMEGPEPFGDCLLGHHGGKDGCHCPIRPAWDVLQNQLTAFMAETTLQDLQVSHDLSSISEEPDRPDAVPV